MTTLLFDNDTVSDAVLLPRRFGHGRLSVVFLALLLMACSRNTKPREETQQAQGPAQAPQPGGSAPSKGSGLDEPDSFDSVKYEQVSRLGHKISSTSLVQVDLHPYCEPQTQPPGGTSPVEREEWDGLKTSAYEDLPEQASKFSDFVGLVLDGSRRKIVLVFEPGFTSWDAIQMQLKPEQGDPIELRPGCHTKAQRARALALLTQFQSAKPSPIHGWAEEPSVAGFRVFVLPGDHKAAAHVREQLGSIANVWFSRPFGAH